MATYNSINSNVQGNNTFLGSGAGNITLSGDFNVGIGSDTLNNLTTGLENVGVGYNVMTNVSTGQHNVTLGNITGTAITTGSSNTIVGSGSGAFLQTGSNNIILGYLSGSNLTTNESDNIIIANSYAGTNLDTGKIVIGVGGVQTTCAIAGIEGVTPSAAGAKVMIVDTNDQLGSLGAMTNGQIIIGSTGANPVVASLTAGANITITPGAGSISIAASGGGSSITWVQADDSTPTTIQPNHGYIVSNFLLGPAILNMDVPSAYNIGDTVIIISNGGAKWQININGTDSFIDYLNSETTFHTGTVSSNATTATSITMVCILAETTGQWVLTSATVAPIVA